MHSTASDARPALGRSPDGTTHLPRGVLSPPAPFGDDRRRAIRNAGRLRRPHRLVEAMHLVRGPLFDGLRRSDWAVFDGTRSRIESLVVGTALRCAEELTGAATAAGRLGGPSGAQGEPLRRTALPLVARATAAEGGRVGVRSTMAEIADAGGGARTSHGGVVQGGPGGDDRLECLHPKTTALYRGLLEGSPAAVGEPPGCRVASRHGEKLFWEIGSPRRLNGRWCRLPGRCRSTGMPRS